MKILTQFNYENENYRVVLIGDVKQLLKQVKAGKFRGDKLRQRGQYQTLSGVPTRWVPVLVGSEGLFVRADAEVALCEIKKIERSGEKLIIFQCY